MNISLEDLINYYLKKIKKSYTISKYNNITSLVNKLYNNYGNYNNILKDEASIIADDLIDKITNKNNRLISIPISIENIINYSISSIIKKKDIDSVIKLVVLKLVITFYCLNL